MLVSIILALLGLGVIAFLARASWNICSGVYIRAHCRGADGEKQLALSFDDGPHAEYTPAVLEVLKKHNIKAAFFVIGENIAGKEDLLKQMAAEGHVIGNHSFVHDNHFPFRSSRYVKEDLQRNAALIKELTGRDCRLFRPPFGVTNPNIARAARSLDYSVVGWSIRSLDGVPKYSEKTIKRVLSRLKPGRLILFHDNHAGIAAILEKVITEARSEGYEFVSPDKLLNIKAYR